MRPILKDAGLQAQFDKKGYIILPEPFLSPEEVEELKQCYFDTLPERGGNYEASETTYHAEAAIPYDFTFTDKNWRYKEKVFDIITAKAGTAVVLDDSVIHFSNINQTNGLRLTIQLIMIPAEAQLVHHSLDLKNPDEVHVLAVERKFSLHFHPWRKPDGQPVAVKPFKAYQLSIAEFKARMKAPRIDAPKPGLLQGVKQLIGA